MHGLFGVKQQHHRAGHCQRYSVFAENQIGAHAEHDQNCHFRSNARFLILHGPPSEIFDSHQHDDGQQTQRHHQGAEVLRQQAADYAKQGDQGESADSGERLFNPLAL